MKKSCAIVQPHYLPWIGYFDLIKKVDIFVFLDDVKYVKREWKNRNKIRKTPTSDEYKWISIPITKKHSEYNINQATISISENIWKKQHSQSIKEVYEYSPFFNEFSSEILNLINKNDFKFLSDLNIKLIEIGCEFLNIKKNFVRSSEFDIRASKKEDRLIKICKKLKMNNYIANNKTYEMVDLENFNKNSINIIPQNFVQTQYQQKYKDQNLRWLSNLSWIDYIFNVGKPY